MEHLVFLSIPGLRRDDLPSMPQLSALFAKGHCATLHTSFPAVTWPAQATMLTGKLPRDHGVVANGIYWRERREVEMWTAGNEVIEVPQIWDRLQAQSPSRSSAVWFPMLAKRCQADYACMPAPVHNPDGSESLWCYTKPTALYGDLLQALGHFPLMNFWGPLASIAGSKWIADSAGIAWEHFQPRPDFLYIYLPHLDYAAQRTGPNSPAAKVALGELDTVIGDFARRIEQLAAGRSVAWMAATEYVIVDVDHVVYPNRILREADMLRVHETDDGEHLDFAGSRAWALVDHQFSHVFVADASDVEAVCRLFRDREGIAMVAAGQEREALGVNHPRSGEVILVSTPNSWQAYYWWLDDQRAPGFARTVDIHRKPGYDPVELFWDREANGVPLDAGRVRGSHGSRHDTGQGVLLTSPRIDLRDNQVKDVDVAELVLNAFHG